MRRPQRTHADAAVSRSSRQAVWPHGWRPHGPPALPGADTMLARGVWFTVSTIRSPPLAVYRIDPDGRVTRVLSQPDIQRPNGIALTPDDKTLYVIDSHPQPG